MKAIYLIDKTLLPNHLVVVRQCGNVYSVACERTRYEWEDDSYYCAPFSGMDNDYRDISEQEALSLIEKFKNNLVKPNH